MHVAVSHTGIDVAAAADVAAANEIKGLWIARGRKASKARSPLELIMIAAAA